MVFHLYWCPSPLDVQTPKSVQVTTVQCAVCSVNCMLYYVCLTRCSLACSINTDELSFYRDSLLPKKIPHLVCSLVKFSRRSLLLHFGPVHFWLRWKTFIEIKHSYWTFYWTNKTEEMGLRSIRKNWNTKKNNALITWGWRKKRKIIIVWQRSFTKNTRWNEV